MKIGGHNTDFLTQMGKKAKIHPHVEGMAKLKGELNPEVARVAFFNVGFKDDVVKTNTIQILKQYGIEDVKSI